MTPIAHHVLIADDYPDLAEGLAEMLCVVCSGPITVAIAHDGAQAVASARERPPAAVILDIDMPVMNGIEAAESIRRTLDTPPLLVAMTGNPSNLSPLREGQLFDHVLAKPVSADALAKLVCRH